MAKAKRKIITTPIKDFSHEGTLRRMEQVVAALESCVIADGWHENGKAGRCRSWRPMP
jgi:hypothetical protein